MPGVMQNGNSSKAQEASSKAYEAVKKLPLQLLIDGKWVDAASGDTYPSLDPRTGQTICDVAKAGKEDVDRAVAAARKAFDSGPWPRMPASQRGRILRRFADLIEDNAEELALIETLDQGKTLTQSMTVDVPATAAHFAYFAGWADKIEGSTVPPSESGGDYTAYTLREPLGVVAQIIPWNFPLLMAAWKLAPALCCGCCVVLKVSQYTPLSAIRLGQLAIEAGIPPGALNIITGKGSEIGDAMNEHPDVDKVAFTGSTSVGKHIMAGAAKGVKPVTLELGGNSPIVVAADADLDAAVKGCHEALFFNTGEACECGARLFVHSSIYDEFVRRSVELAKNRTAGDPFSNDVKHGPLVSQKQLDKVLGYVKQGVEEGAKLQCGGNRIGEEGFLMEPTVFSDVKDKMSIAKDEIFGPVQVIFKWDDLEEVIARANATEYGLASAVWTQSIETMQAVTRGIKAGIVWVNCHHVMDASIPFGGYKESGIGREHGAAVLQHYTHSKSVVIPLPKVNSWKIM